MTVTMINNDIIVTSLRPDIAIVSKESYSIHLLELTVPNNTLEHLERARKRKQEKQEYISLVTDISTNGWSVTYDTIEIGSLGHYSRDSFKAIKSIISSYSNKETRDILLPACKMAMLCSRIIFMARNQLIWNSSKPLLDCN